MLRSDTRRLAAWMACFAILLAALAPSISSVLAAGRTQGLALVEICTPAGLARIWLMQERTPAADGPVSAHAAQCPFCLPHPGALALPTAGVLAVAGTALASAPALPAARPLPRRLGWARPRSRAPPAFG